jgi:hypothetical protein
MQLPSLSLNLNSPLFEINKIKTKFLRGPLYTFKNYIMSSVLEKKGGGKWLDRTWQTKERYLVWKI